MNLPISKIYIITLAWINHHDAKKKIFFKWSDELQFSYGKKDIKSQAPLIGVLMSAYFWRFCLVTSRPVGLDPNNNKLTVIS